MKRRTEIVSFRADESLLIRLDRDRKPLALSRGDLVREIVVAHFHAIDDRSELPALFADFRQLLEQADESLQHIARNQRRALIIQLHASGMELAQAKEIVKCKLSS